MKKLYYGYPLYTTKELETNPNSYGGPCLDCNGTNEPYMLTKELWSSITTPIERRAFLCLKCVESRLNRKLTVNDLNTAPINDGIFGFNVKEWIRSGGGHV